MSKESLKDKAVVISGVFEKFSRKELKDIIDEAGEKHHLQFPKIHHLC